MTAANRGHVAVVHAPGDAQASRKGSTEEAAAATAIGRPLDFRVTLKHINARAASPAMQRFARSVSRFFFPAECAPVFIAAPPRSANAPSGPPLGDTARLLVGAAGTTAAGSGAFVSTASGMGSLISFSDSEGGVWMMGHNHWGQCGVGRVVDNEVVYEPSEKVVGLGEIPRGARPWWWKSAGQGAPFSSQGAPFSKPHPFGLFMSSRQAQEGASSVGSRSSNSFANSHLLGGSLHVSFPASGAPTGSAAPTDPSPLTAAAESATVTQVVCGFEHVLALTPDGRLFAWGRGDRGQLGLGDKDAYMRAARVLGPRDLFLAADSAPPAAAAADADPSGLPDASAGIEAGVASRIERRRLLLRTEASMGTVTAIAAGVSQSACITLCGDLYIWGKMAGLDVRETRADGALMEDQIVPRRVHWPDEEDPDVEIGDGGGAVSAASAADRGKESAAAISADSAAPAAAAASSNATSSPSSPLSKKRTRSATPLELQAATSLGGSAGARDGPLMRPAHRRVVAVTMGPAHTSFATADARLWMLGLRGRGRLYDDSASLVSGWARALAKVSSGDPVVADAAAAVVDMPPGWDDWSRFHVTSSKGAVVSEAQAGPERGAGATPTTETTNVFVHEDAHARVLAAVRETLRAHHIPASVDSADPLTLTLEVANSIDTPLPEVYMQTTPVEIQPGPLAETTVVALRSDAHFSYAITSDGRVFRWGWKGIVVPVVEWLPYHVIDIQFGHRLAVAVVRGGG